MKIHVMSDLHLEFDQYSYEIPKTDADVIVLAGDIGLRFEHRDWMIKQLFNHNKPIIYVMGNHEFYRGNITTVTNSWNDFSKVNKNFHLLDNNSVTIDGVKFIGSTLWTDAPTPDDENHLDWGMNDFSIIELRGKRFSASDASLLHKYAVDYIKLAHESRKPDEKVVVVSHHAPSFKSSAACFIGSALNCGFATDLEWLIEESDIDLWIHGHMHNRSDYMIGDTRIVANPRGYPGEQKYGGPAFNETLIIEV